MNWVKTIVTELFGLFVDDGAFAVAILAWLALVALLAPRLGFGTGIEGVLLFLGLAAILAESAGRRARRG